MVKKKKSNKAQASIEVIAGLLIITGGFFYLLNKGSFGIIPITVGLLIEAIVKYLK